MPRQYSPEFRQRALRLLDTMMEASDTSEFEAIKSVAGKLGIAENRCAGGGARPRSMPVNVQARPALSMQRYASSGVRMLSCAEPMKC